MPVIQLPVVPVVGGGSKCYGVEQKCRILITARSNTVAELKDPIRDQRSREKLPPYNQD